MVQEYKQGDWKVKPIPEDQSWAIISESGSCICEVLSKEADAYLIIATRNACGKLNPDNPMAVAKAIPDLYKAGKKLVKWLHMLANNAEENAKMTRFVTMKKAWEADTLNYRATAKDMEQALAKAERR